MSPWQRNRRPWTAGTHLCLRGRAGRPSHRWRKMMEDSITCPSREPANHVPATSRSTRLIGEGYLEEGRVTQVISAAAFPQDRISWPRKTGTKKKIMLMSDSRASAPMEQTTYHIFHFCCVGLAECGWCVLVCTGQCQKSKSLLQSSPCIHLHKVSTASQYPPPPTPTHTASTQSISRMWVTTKSRGDQLPIQSSRSV